VVGAGRDWPTAQEAALKLCEGTFVAAEAYHTEQLLHGHLAAIDETVRAIILEGEGRAGERSHDVVRAVGEIGCASDLLPQAEGWERPILGILPFHLLVLALAERRGVNPDRIRWDEEPWNRARQSYS
jgi:fructoselysine-6-P-deglycase FrlB-like protein